MRKLLYLICLCLACISTSIGQDEHFTRYDFAPVFFNPANTGNFYGSYRASLLYRDQFRSFYGGGSNYSTPTISLDANFDFALRDQDWTSFGITVISDEAGDIGLGSLGYMGSAAYHLAFDKKRGNVLTIGAQYGSVSIRVTDPDKIRDEAKITGNGTEPINIENVEASYTDLNLGVRFSSMIGKTSRFEMGMAMGHVLKPDFTLMMGRRNDIGTRINGHAKIRFLATKGISLEPVIYLSAMHQNTNIQAQLNSAILLNADKELALTAGLGYRVGDAAEILLGMNYGLWKVGLAYDLTLSSAADATDRFGGFELGISRIIYQYKRPKINPILLCPHL